MSIEPVRINVISKLQKENTLRNVEIYKETSMIHNHYLKEKEQRNIGNDSNKSNKLQWKWILKIKLIRTILAFMKRGSNLETQLEVFQGTMKYCIISGQWLGLFPFTNITKMNIQENRYQLFSWRYLLCFMNCSGHMMALILSFYALAKTVNISRFSFFLFYMSNFFTCILFMRLATKWHYLIKQVVASGLNEYLDSSVRFKGNIATIIILGFAIVEYIFSRIAKLAAVQDCGIDDDSTYEQFIITSYTWIFEVGVPYSLPVGIYLLFLNTSATLIWSYSHIFIICASLYLTSILEQLNKKIISREGQHLPASYWRKLREDYNKATRLVRTFDAAINSIVFTSFASNLFFVCLQLYYVLARYIQIIHNISRTMCPKYPSGLFNGYEHAVYYTFSIIFVLSRSLAVSLTAAQVHSASLVAAPSLYNVPSSSYGTEVQRFLEQIHGDTVALTGLNFFYVTKELVLSVIGTVVTYELVLLQLNE